MGYLRDSLSEVVAGVVMCEGCAHQKEMLFDGLEVDQTEVSVPVAHFGVAMCDCKWLVFREDLRATFRRVLDGKMMLNKLVKFPPSSYCLSVLETMNAGLLARDRAVLGVGRLKLAQIIVTLYPDANVSALLRSRGWYCQDVVTESLSRGYVDVDVPMERGLRPLASGSGEVSLVMNDCALGQRLWTSSPVVRARCDGRELSIPGVTNYIDVSICDGGVWVLTTLQPLRFVSEEDAVDLSGLCYLATVSAHERYDLFQTLGYNPVAAEPSLRDTTCGVKVSVERGCVHVEPGGVETFAEQIPPSPLITVGGDARLGFESVELTPRQRKSRAEQLIPLYDRVTSRVAVDCEYQLAVDSGGKRHVRMGRVSVVNSDGRVIYDTFVYYPDQIDYRKELPPVGLKLGVTWKDIDWDNGPTPVAHVRNVLWRVFSMADVIVGHSLHSDLVVMGSAVLPSRQVSVRDVQLHEPYRGHAGTEERLPKLSVLASRILNREVQQREHSSVEDANATMALYMARQQAIDVEQRGWIWRNSVLERTGIGDDGGRELEYVKYARVLADKFSCLSPELWPESLIVGIFVHSSVGLNTDLPRLAALGRSVMRAALEKRLWTADVPYSAWNGRYLQLQSKDNLARVAHGMDLVSYINAASNVDLMRSGVGAGLVEALVGAVEIFQPLKVDEVCDQLGII